MHAPPKTEAQVWRGAGWLESLRQAAAEELRARGRQLSKAIIH
jgi:hypothetical protein